MAWTDMSDFDERDFDEVDHDEDEQPTSEKISDAPEPVLGAPSVIVDDVHVTYRVFGGRRRSSAPEMGRVKSLFNRSRNYVGAVSEVHAVRGVSFAAHHGESIGIIGMNGAGKSTLLRAIAGLLPVSSGGVYVAGKSALLGVNAALVRSLTGERNIMIGGLALGLSKKEVRQSFDQIVDFAGIGDFVHLPMKAYSSGTAARLRFAISTASVPDVLMIDEALTTGDAAFRARSKERIEEIRERAGTVFLVSHSIRAIERMCDRALWIDHGQLVADGPTEEVTEQYRRELKKRR